ncbi:MULTISPECIES: hypothetical protein [Stenotrophomonas]|uniref:hypothetical protein n=1 Tax=Stenotrophomonas TaxID=40323 RepID=UPI00113274C1|nr:MULTISPECIES: hypothetical protein [Stenotrophomonas]MBD3680300.1 hypothetical protein [Stenotrophomonas sp. Br8]
MELLRILRREICFRQVIEGELNEDSLCGSAVRNFEVHQKYGAISFYSMGSGDQPLGLERIAMAVTVGTQKLDDVAYCVVDDGQLQALGLEVNLDGGGTTKIANVDKNHVSVKQVTLRRLVGMTLECARRVGVKDPTVVARGRVAFEVDQALKSNELDQTKFDPKFARALSEARKSNPYKVAMRGAG